MRRACLLLILTLGSGCALPTLAERPAWTKSDTLPPGVAAKYPKDRYLWRGPNATGEDRRLSKQLSAAVHKGYGIVPGTFGGSPYTQSLRRRITAEATPIDELAYSWNVVHRWKYRGTHGETSLNWEVLERSAPLAYYAKRARALSDGLEETLTKLRIASLAPFEKERRWVLGIEQLFALDVLRAFCVELGLEARDPMFRRLSSPIAKDFAARIRKALDGLKPKEVVRRERLTAALEQFSTQASGKREFEGAPRAPTDPRYKVPARPKTELDVRLDAIEAACGPKVRAQAAIVLRRDRLEQLIDRKGILRRDPTAVERDAEERSEALGALGRLGVGKPPVLSLLTEALETPALAIGALQGLEALGTKARPAADDVLELLADAKLRPAAISTLVALEAPKSADPLLKARERAEGLLKQSDAKARVQGLTEIGRFGNASLGEVASITSRLAAKDLDEAQAAAWALSRLGPPGRKALAAALKSDDATVRARAVAGYAEVEGADPAPIRAALNDADGGVRFAAVAALGRLKDVESVPQLLAELVKVPAASGPNATNAIRALLPLVPKLSPKQAERLRNLLRMRLPASGATATVAASALAALAPGSIPELLKAANQSEPRMKANALIALAQAVPTLKPDLLQKVVPILAEVDDGPALSASGAGLARVVDRLEPDLFVNDRPRRLLALRLMLQIGPLSCRALGSLRTILNDDPDPQLRTQAAAVLSAIGLEAGPAIDDLENAAKRDPNAQVKAAAKSAFERVDRAVKAFEKR